MEFSILIPTWNNRPYLQNCLESLKKHSQFNHQIIVIINEGSDDTLNYVNQKNLEFIHHKTNVGICVGLNSVTKLIKKSNVVYMNDDMYVLPGWDTAIVHEIGTIKHQKYMLSSTMIEPFETGNKCVLVKHFGDKLENFQEAEVLQFHGAAQKEDWNGSTWPPFVLPTQLWKDVGGMSEEFSPGMYSDPDLSMKLWKHGVRYFKGIGASRVYHFGKKSTSKLGKHVGRQIFLKKWKVTAGYFYRNYLNMGEKWKGELPDFKVPIWDRIIHRFKK